MHMNILYWYSRIKNAAIITIALFLLICYAAVEDYRAGNGLQENGQVQEITCPLSFGINTVANQSGINRDVVQMVRKNLTENINHSAGEGEESPQIRLVMVGDVLLHESVIDSGKQKDGSYRYDGLFANVKETIQAADMALVNQETILGGSELGLFGYPTFNSPYEIGDSEVNSGFNIILHATNHAYDMRENGVENCIRFWKTNHPDTACLGINSSQKHQDEYLYVYEKDGIRIAVLNYTYGINGGNALAERPYLINCLDKDRVVSDIARAHKQADFVIVCPHWGTEYNLGIDESQERWTQIFFENGVDLVIGAHPHAIEPIEWVTDEHGRDMLVYYSLGNFISGIPQDGGREVLYRTLGGMAEVTIGLDADGEASIREYGITPLVTHCENGSYTTYFLSDYTQEFAEKNEFREKIPDYSLKKYQKHVKNVWGSLAGKINKG